MKIRTRIAPSPTGDPHVGTAYAALFNKCFAHSQGGEFILRIEDTDQARSSAKAEAAIFAALDWLGLHWDEGPDKSPDKGGSCGPYRQSERRDIYQEHIERLLQQGDAFPCFCTAERLAQLRQQQVQTKQQPGYDGHCLALDPAEAAKRRAAGEPCVIRLKVPASGESSFSDMLRGDISIDWGQIDMQVLLKSDGLPTYHFANVVDDHLMGISHIIRGEEWLNSIPKHLLLYKAFGWQPPQFCHLPLLRNPDKSKLSKRKNPTAINYYRDMGYLPQALVNYLGMMGWSLPSGEEKFSLQEMTDNFDISRVSLGGPVFDPAKLDWLNGRYLREDFSPQQFMQAYAAWAFGGEQGRHNGGHKQQGGKDRKQDHKNDKASPESPQKMHLIAALVQQRVERFSDVVGVGGHFFAGLVDLPNDAFASLTAQKMSNDDIKRILQFTLWHLEALPEFSQEAVESCLKGLAQALDLKIRDFLAPLFIAISGRPVSVSVIAAIAILGLDLSRARLRHAITHLGGISKKQAKALETAYQTLLQ